MSDKTTEMLEKYREKNLKLLKELRQEKKNMRRIDKLIYLMAMSVEDIAKMMYYSYCKSDCDIPYRGITENDCWACVVKWLEEEIEIKEGETE